MRSVPPCKMEPLYAKFPAQPKPAAKTMPAVATATPLAFGGRPSVGTWLMPKPKNSFAAAIAQPEQKSVPFTAPFKDYYACHMRSVPPRNMESLYANFPAQQKPQPGSAQSQLEKAQAEMKEMEVQFQCELLARRARS